MQMMLPSSIKSRNTPLISESRPPEREDLPFWWQLIPPPMHPHGTQLHLAIPPSHTASRSALIEVYQPSPQVHPAFSSYLTGDQLQ